MLSRIGSKNVSQIKVTKLLLGEDSQCLLVSVGSTVFTQQIDDLKSCQAILSEDSKQSINKKEFKHIIPVPEGMSSGCLVGRLICSSSKADSKKSKHFPCFWEQKNSEWHPVVVESIKNMTGDLIFVSKNKNLIIGNCYGDVAGEAKLNTHGFIYNMLYKNLIKIGEKKGNNFQGISCKINACSKDGSLSVGEYNGLPAIFNYHAGPLESVSIETENGPGSIRGMISDGCVLYGELDGIACIWIKNNQNAYARESLLELIKRKGLEPLQKYKNLRIIKISDDRKLMLVAARILRSSNRSGCDVTNKIYLVFIDGLD